MHVLVAPDKFKGSLTARQVAERVAAGISAEAPGVAVHQVPVADGGDGTVAAALAAGYQSVTVVAEGPTGQPVRTAFAMREGTAVVEMADVSGLRLLLDSAGGAGLAPLTASSYGTGQVIRAALDAGCHTVVLGIGGSASTDGGAGMLAALGARLLDSAGAEAARRRGSGRAAPSGPQRTSSCSRNRAVRGGQRRGQLAARAKRRGSGLRAAEGGKPRTSRGSTTRSLDSPTSSTQPSTVR